MPAVSSGMPPSSGSIDKAATPVPAKVSSDSLPFVAVIIVHWLNMADTLECLDSLARVDYSHLQVILVNNGSSDFDEPAARRTLPAVDVLTSPTNLGFAAGNNLAIADALEGGADLL